MPPDIPGAKRAGLPVDLDRLTAEGDEWLSPEERYALKMHGLCAQAQPGVFMVRVRVGGVLESDAARGLARIADDYAGGWIHLTTRQQVQLHHVGARDVTTVLGQIRRLGLTTRSTCGHTMRGVMSCPDAGVGLEEPFDCYPKVFFGDYLGIDAQGGRVAVLYHHFIDAKRCGISAAVFDFVAGKQETRAEK